MRGFIGGLSLLGMLLIQTGCSEDEVTPPRQAVQPLPQVATTAQPPAAPPVAPAPQAETRPAPAAQPAATTGTQSSAPKEVAASNGPAADKPTGAQPVAENRPAGEKKPAEGPSDASKAAVARAVSLLTNGEQKRGLSLLLAEAVCGNKAVLESLRWSPKLARPLFVLRCGMVVQVPGLKGVNDPQQTRKARGVLRASAADAVNYWGPAVGQPVLDNLKQRVQDGKFGKWLQGAKPAPPAVDPGTVPGGLPGIPPIGLVDDAGILNFDMMEATKAKAAAAERGLDVLFVGIITCKPVQVRGRVRRQSTLTMEIVDVRKDEVLWTSEPVTGVGGDDSLAMDSRNETCHTMVDAMLEYFDDRLLPTAMPALKPEIVKKRAEALTSAESTDPLPALAELRYYELKKLLTPQQLSGYFAKLVGAEDGPQLATGPEAARRQVLARLRHRGKEQ